MQIKLGLTLLGLGLAATCSQAQTSLSLGDIQIRSTRQVRVGKDTLIYNLLAAPPTVNVAPTAPAIAPVAPDPEEAKLKSVFLSVTANVYDGPVTELVWTDGDEQVHRVLSNVDFSHFPANFDLKLGDTHYSVMIFTFNYGGAGPWFSSDTKIAAKYGQARAVLQGVAGYDFEEVTEPGVTATQTDVAALEMLHAYYTVNHETMIATALKLATDNEELSRKLEEEALRPKTFVHYIWREPAPAR